MSDTTTQYQPRDYRRVADCCGQLYNRSELYRKGPWTFCYQCEPEGTRIIEEENEAIARQRPFRILPVPNPKPLLIDNLYSYIAEEGVLFDFIVSTAPARSLGGATDPLAAAWATAYLSDVVAQNSAVSLTNRPQAWVISATTKIKSLLSYLLTQQTGSPTGPASTAQDPRYGGFQITGFYTPSLATAAGLAFIKAYRALGNAEYLSAANRVATFLRHLQCGDLQASSWTVYPGGGSPYRVGGVASTVNDSTGIQSGIFSIADAGNALTFLMLLQAVVGASATYGDASATSFFSASTQATIAVMISTLTTFLSVGPTDFGASGANVTGLSATKPQSSYSAAIHGGAGTASWSFGSTIAGSTIAFATSGLFAALGATAQVTSILAWLAAATPNAANATPATNTPQQTLNANTGAYNPATAPATSLTASVPFTEATGALYDLAALGLLAPVLSAVKANSLRSARATVSTGVPWSTFYLDLRYLGTLGRAGLSLQPHSSGSQSVSDVVFASQFGAVYRYSNP